MIPPKVHPFNVDRVGRGAHIYCEWLSFSACTHLLIEMLRVFLFHAMIKGLYMNPSTRKGSSL